jgi:hypothetical protein
MNGRSVAGRSFFYCLSLQGMKYSFSSLFALVAFVLHSQSFVYPEISKSGKKISEFIPAGWTILDSVSGDLNKDSIPDYALALEYKDSAMLIQPCYGRVDTFKAKPRMLAIILYSDFSNAYNLYVQSNSFIFEHDNPQMEDPLADLEITKGVLKISFSLFSYSGTYWVFGYSYKWRFQNGVFVLIGADYSEFSRSSHEFTDRSYNLLTGKWSETTGDDNDDSSKKTQWHKLNGSQLQTFKSFSRPLTWEITKGIYL